MDLVLAGDNSGVLWARLAQSILERSCMKVSGYSSRTPTAFFTLVQNVSDLSFELAVLLEGPDALGVPGASPALRTGPALSAV